MQLQCNLQLATLFAILKKKTFTVPKTGHGKATCWALHGKPDKKKDDNDYSNTECWLCSEKGHTVRVCPNKKKFVNDNDDAEAEINTYFHTNVITLDGEVDDTHVAVTQSQGDESNQSNESDDASNCKKWCCKRIKHTAELCIGRPVRANNDHSMTTDGVVVGDIYNGIDNNDGDNTNEATDGVVTLVLVGDNNNNATDGVVDGDVNEVVGDEFNVDNGNNRVGATDGVVVGDINDGEMIRSNDRVGATDGVVVGDDDNSDGDEVNIVGTSVGVDDDAMSKGNCDDATDNTLDDNGNEEAKGNNNSSQRKEIVDSDREIIETND